MGLGAALLSDDRHAHIKTGGHRPVNLKKIMATLVVQRALKRNMNQRKGKFNLADIVLAAESQTRRVSRTRQDLPNPDGLCSLLGNRALEDMGRLSPTGQLSTTGLGGLEGQEKQEQRWQQHKQQQRERSTRGSAGAIVLPPGANESKWLMQRFLVDLQRHNDKDDEEGGEVLSTSRSGSVSQAAGGGSNTALSRATAMQELKAHDSCSRSSGAGTEIGSPSPRGPARTPDRDDVGYGIPDEERLDGQEGKMEEAPVTSLEVWLRDRDSVDLG